MKTNTTKTLLLSVITFVLSASVLPGCVPMWTGDEMQQDIEAIRAEQKAMQENYDSEKTRLTKMIASAREDVTELKKVLKEARALLQRNNADLGVEIQKNREEINHLRGNIEELEFKIKRLEQDLKLFKEDVDVRFADGENLPDEPVALFDQAKKAYDEGKYGQARRAFARFVERFPSHGKAADAQYLLGMTHYQQKNWYTAVSELGKVVQNYDKSTRVDDATYHIGQALMNLGECEQAKGWFQLLISEHGNSEFVGTARQKLNAIKAGNCK